MKRIALYDADATKYRNLALLKLAAAHRAAGNHVEWFMPLERYDDVFCSGVFSWTADNPYLPAHTHYGGTKYNFASALPDHIEHICPDYDFGKLTHSMGFLTRGCPNKCPWCIVPLKEGDVRPHADIEEFCRHRDVVLMDNNILACTEGGYGVKQLEKMARLGLRVDFNQGLDSRLIDAGIAKRLAALKWLHPIRLACDRSSQMQEVERAVKLLRSAGAKPERYFCYLLVNDVSDALERALFLRGLNVDPFAQPFRPLDGGKPPSREQKDFARWVNHKAIFKSVAWLDYKGRERLESGGAFDYGGKS